MFSPQYVPSWAVASQSTCKAGSFQTTICSGMVSNIQDWKNYVTALVTRYKGRIQYYELWNEPENWFSGTVAEMVELTNAEHDIIRSIDPAAKILSPSAVSYGSAYIDSYFTAGGTTDVDTVSMHLYPNTSNDVAEAIAASAPVSMETVMSKHGLSGKPLWNTESSWGYASKGAITNSDLRAAFIARNFLLHWSVGLGRVYWYAWDSSDIGTLWSSTGGANEAATALKTVYGWMVGSTMSTCSENGASSPYPAMYTCNMKLSTGASAQVVWYTDGNKTYSAPTTYAHYMDLTGATHSIPSNHQVTIGTKPILLEK